VKSGVRGFNPVAVSPDLELDPFGMQGESWSWRKIPAVETVALDGKSKVGEVDADLVHDSGLDFQVEFESGQSLGNAGFPGNMDFPPFMDQRNRLKGLSPVGSMKPLWDCDHSFFALRVVCKGGVDHFWKRMVSGATPASGSIEFSKFPILEE